MSDLDSILHFSRLMTKLSTTERFINKAGTEVREDLAEHCTQLAFTAWYLIDKHNLPLDKAVVFEYALVHDIVETYTGDFPTHQPDCDRAEKERLEHEAFLKIQQDFPDAPNLWERYQQYEERADNESKFIYTLDKLLPALNIYLNNGKAWSEREPKNNTWSFNDVSKRMEHNSFISEIWEEFRKRIEEEHPEFFA